MFTETFFKFAIGLMFIVAMSTCVLYFTGYFGDDQINEAQATIVR